MVVHFLSSLWCHVPAVFWKEVFELVQLACYVICCQLFDFSVWFSSSVASKPSAFITSTTEFVVRLSASASCFCEDLLQLFSDLEIHFQVEIPWLACFQNSLIERCLLRGSFSSGRSTISVRFQRQDRLLLLLLHRCMLFFSCCQFFAVFFFNSSRVSNFFVDVFCQFIVKSWYFFALNG